MSLTYFPQKTIGPYTVYERTPKPKGMTKYFVMEKGDPKMTDFGRYSVAVRYCKQRIPKPTPHIVVFDNKSAVATTKVDYTILDGPHKYSSTAEVDPATVAGIIGAKTKEQQ